MTFIFKIAPYKVCVSRDGVRLFNSHWPCSSLTSYRAYWFEFDASRNLVDTDVPEQDDNGEAAAMAADCSAWLFDHVLPEWLR